MISRRERVKLTGGELGGREIFQKFVQQFRVVDEGEHDQVLAPAMIRAPSLAPVWRVRSPAMPRWDVKQNHAARAGCPACGGH